MNTLLRMLYAGLCVMFMFWAITTFIYPEGPPKSFGAMSFFAFLTGYFGALYHLCVGRVA